jgi:pimeloyl-ACP methyl ester carboxylesterase
MSESTPAAAAPVTVVLVHGAFADASSWTGVVEQLRAEGVQVTAPANPLRGISYVAAFAPDEGERLIDAEGTSKDSVLSAALVPRVGLAHPSG